MKRYLGVKVIDAEPMSKEMAIVTGYKVGETTDGDGYEVTYEGGYKSWSPFSVFDKAYRPIDGLTFGLAIEAMKLGKLVSRKGWNGKDMFVFKQIPAEIEQHIIPNMQSVPDDMKDRMSARSQRLNYRNQMCIVDSVGNVDSWVPSSSDVFAEDWCIVE